MLRMTYETPVSFLDVFQDRAPKNKKPSREGFSRDAARPVRGAASVSVTYAKFFAAKSQFTMFQNASTNFGRALR